MSPKHTVLVVDDEPDVVQSVQELLRQNYRVLGATRASDALAILEKESVDVVMTDQRMPDMTGVEFLHQVRDAHPATVRLLFTGYSDVHSVIDAINQGSVYRYVTKPWDFDELQTIVREAAERHDLIAERDRLLADLQRKNSELEAANAELRRGNELKVAFFQVASHELRTPLTILLGESERAQRTLAADDRAGLWLGRIVHASERLRRLVDQIVTMLEAGRYDHPLECRAVDVAALMQQAADDVRAFVELRGQEMVVDLGPDLGTMDLDADRIRDSINHLLLNAIKFTPDGGRIQLAARRLPDGSAEIRVTDNGIGIDAASMPQLFQPFFTGFDSRHRPAGHFEIGGRGVGLGLSIVKTFIGLHGGSVSVTSETERGTTVTIFLPAGPGRR